MLKKRRVSHINWMWLQPSVSMRPRMFQIHCFDTKHCLIYFIDILDLFFFKEQKILNKACSRNKHSRVPRKPKKLSTSFPFFFPHSLSQRYQFSMAPCFSSCYRNFWFQCFQSFKMQYSFPFLIVKERVLICATASKFIITYLCILWNNFPSII